jgi:PAS domain S-box-containing protein
LGVAIDQVVAGKRWRGSTRDVALMGAVAVVYFGAAKLGLALAFSNRSVTAVWPPSGLALAAVLLCGARVWPGIALGAFLANLTTQGSVPAVAGIATGNTLEALIGAFLLSWVGFRPDLERLRDVGALVVLAGALSTLVAATIGVASLAADGLVQHGAFVSTWRVWWLGDFCGDLLVGSAILVLSATPRPPRRGLWLAEAIAVTAALVAVSAFVFSGTGVGAYAALPLLFWLALRFGQPGAVLGGLLVSGLAVWFTKHGQGPFVGGTLDSGLLRAQTFVGISTVTALVVAAVRSEQRSSEEAEAKLREAFAAQRRQAEALREAEERFRGAFEHAAIGMALVAPDGRWLRVNRAVCEIVGYSEQELLQRRFQDLTHPDDLDADLERVDQMLCGAISSYQLDKRYIHRDGDVVWITLSVSLVHDAAGKPLYFVSQIQDITERKRSQIALQDAVESARAARADAEHANLAKSEFLSRMSHELRTPLNAILGFSQLLELEDLSASQREGVGHIVTSGRRLLELIQDVLDIGRIESGDLPISLEPVSVAEITTETIELMRPLASARRISLATRLDSVRGLHVLADRRRLGQVLLNLLSNAVKYNVDGGTVTLASTVADKFVRLEVADSGPGIAPEKVPLLFAPFERLGAEQLNIEGTGLGLTLAKSMIEAMDGRIQVNTAVGRGTTVTLELPGALASSSEEQAQTLDRERDGPLIDHATRGTLLYIEDSPTNIRLVEAILRFRPNVELISATTADQGLKLANEHAPPLILLDLHLPDESGDIVLQRLRKDPRTADARIAISSADATPGQVERLLAAGADQYIIKPLDVESLLRIVDSALADSRGGTAMTGLGARTL